MCESESRFGRVVCLLCVLFLLSRSAVVSRGDDRVLFSFDGDTKLSVEWSAVGKITANRQEVPETAESGLLAPAENGVTVETAGKAGLFAKSGTVPTDWEDSDSVSFWLYRSPDEASTTPQSIIEVQVYEPGGRARFWRKVEVSHTGWKEFTLPLKWFRWGTGKRPRWDQMDRFGFWFRDPANVSIDTIWITESGQEKTAYFSHEELQEAAFPEVDQGVQVTETDSVVLLSRADPLGSVTLATHLDRVAAAIRRDLPFLSPPVRKPVLVVFATRQAYENFAPTFAQRFRSTASRPMSTGFTFHGIATSYSSDNGDAVRPSYTHEFIHSILAQSARLSNGGEWLQEGLASLYQIRFHPQTDFREIIQEGIENENYRAPLKTLCNGERIPANRYWQALTLLDMLMRAEPWRDRFPDLFQTLQNAKTTNLEPHLDSVLQTSWDDMTADWMEFCRAQYVSKPLNVNQSRD